MDTPPLSPLELLFNPFIFDRMFAKMDVNPFEEAEAGAEPDPEV